jgi:probable rRNA maturation factor
MSVKPLNRSTPMDREPAVESPAQGTGSTIAVLNRQRTKKINLHFLKQIAVALFTELELDQLEIGINLVGSKEMTRLNETFLRHQGSTDVITFDYSAPGRQTRDARPKIHGEIFICVDEAVRQARRFRTRWQSEIVRYLAHGFLHLLGFDDAQAGARRRMKREENRLLRKMSRRFFLSKL